MAEKIFSNRNLLHVAKFSYQTPLLYFSLCILFFVALPGSNSGKVIDFNFALASEASKYTSSEWMYCLSFSFRLRKTSQNLFCSLEKESAPFAKENNENKKTCILLWCLIRRPLSPWNAPWIENHSEYGVDTFLHTASSIVWNQFQIPNINRNIQIQQWQHINWIKLNLQHASRM